MRLLVTAGLHTAATVGRHEDDNDVMTLGAMHPPLAGQLRFSGSGKGRRVRAAMPLFEAEVSVDATLARILRHTLLASTLKAIDIDDSDLDLLKPNALLADGDNVATADDDWRPDIDSYPAASLPKLRQDEIRLQATGTEDQIIAVGPSEDWKETVEDSGRRGKIRTLSSEAKEEGRKEMEERRDVTPGQAARPDLPSRRKDDGGIVLNEQLESTMAGLEDAELGSLERTKQFIENAGGSLVLGMPPARDFPVELPPIRLANAENAKYAVVEAAEVEGGCTSAAAAAIASDDRVESREGEDEDDGRFSASAAIGSAAVAAAPVNEIVYKIVQEQEQERAVRVKGGDSARHAVSVPTGSEFISTAIPEREAKATAVGTGTETGGATRLPIMIDREDADSFPDDDGAADCMVKALAGSYIADKSNANIFVQHPAPDVLAEEIASVADSAVSVSYLDTAPVQRVEELVTAATIKIDEESSHVGQDVPLTIETPLESDEYDSQDAPNPDLAASGDDVIQSAADITVADSGEALTRDTVDLCATSADNQRVVGATAWVQDDDERQEPSATRQVVEDTGNSVALTAGETNYTAVASTKSSLDNSARDDGPHGSGRAAPAQAELTSAMNISDMSGATCGLDGSRGLTHVVKHDEAAGGSKLSHEISFAVLDDNFAVEAKEGRGVAVMNPPFAIARVLPVESSSERSVTSASVRRGARSDGVEDDVHENVELRGAPEDALSSPADDPQTVSPSTGLDGLKMTTPIAVVDEALVEATNTQSVTDSSLWRDARERAREDGDDVGRDDASAQAKIAGDDAHVSAAFNSSTKSLQRSTSGQDGESKVGEQDIKDEHGLNGDDDQAPRRTRPVFRVPDAPGRATSTDGCDVPAMPTDGRLSHGSATDFTLPPLTPIDENSSAVKRSALDTTSPDAAIIFSDRTLGGRRQEWVPGAKRTAVRWARAAVARGAMVGCDWLALCEVRLMRIWRGNSNVKAVAMTAWGALAEHLEDPVLAEVL